MTHRKRRHRLKLRSLYIWHRVVGVCAALFVLILAATGLMLNHTDSLGLDKRFVHAEPLLGWYGITPPGKIVSFPVGGHRVSQVGNILYLDDKPLPGEAGRLLGAVALNETIVAAVENHLWLLTADGRLVEKLGALEGVPASLRAIGLDSGGRLVVQASHNTYTTDTDLLAWQAQPVDAARWAQPAPLPDALRDKLTRRYRGDGLPLERVVLDIHSGRIVGVWGVYVMDAAAALFIFLATSGAWIWARNRMRQRTHRQRTR